MEDNTKHTTEAQHKSLDIAGLLILISAVTCILIFLQLVQTENVDSKPYILTGVGILFLICSISFSLSEALWAKNPLIPLYLLRPSKLGFIYGARVLMGLGDYAVCAHPTPINRNY